MPRGNGRLPAEHDSWIDNTGAAVESEAQLRIRFANLLREANEAHWLGNIPRCREIMERAIGMLK